LVLKAGSEVAGESFEWFGGLTMSGSQRTWIPAFAGMTKNP
jgi:hypothetical protein